MNSSAQWIFIEAFFYLGFARIMKTLPFSSIAPYLGSQMLETSYKQSPDNLKVIHTISQSINIISRYTFWETKCLDRAIAAMKMLERRKIDSTLYLGTSREENGKLNAHAWLRSGQYYVTGADVMDKFTVVAKFAKKINF